jgi:uncharacterized membrane protein (UPF0127 family)
VAPIRVVNRTRGTVLGDRVRLADSLVHRMRGFLFRSEPEPGEGILLTPCQAVHMIGMRYALDVVLIDEGGTVVATHSHLRPWRWTPIHRAALHALELPAGTISDTDTRTGDALSWASVDPEPASDTEATEGAGRRDGRRRIAPRKAGEHHER